MYGWPNHGPTKEKALSNDTTDFLGCVCAGIGSRVGISVTTSFVEMLVNKLFMSSSPYHEWMYNREIKSGLYLQFGVTLCLECHRDILGDAYFKFLANERMSCVFTSCVAVTISSDKHGSWATTEIEDDEISRPRWHPSQGTTGKQLIVCGYHLPNVLDICPWYQLSGRKEIAARRPVSTCHQTIFPVQSV